MIAIDGAPLGSRCGFGGAPIGDLRRAPDSDAVDQLLARAWDAGIRHFDTAPFYGSGLSERRLGDFLRRRDPGEYTIATKVGRLLVPDAEHGRNRWGAAHAMPFRPVFDYSYDGVMRSFEFSLQRLGLVKIDLLLLHDLGRQTHGDAHEHVMASAMSGGAKALRELREQRVISKIGLGANEWEVCAEALDHLDLDVVLLAGRYTLLDQGAVEVLLPLCLRRGVSVIAASVFHRGILATGAIEGALEYGRPTSEETRSRVAAIEAICTAHGVRLPAAALAFPFTHPAVQMVLPGFSSVRELEDNLAHLASPPTADLWTDLVDAGLIRMT